MVMQHRYSSSGNLASRSLYSTVVSFNMDGCHFPRTKFPVHRDTSPSVTVIGYWGNGRLPWESNKSRGMYVYPCTISSIDLPITFYCPYSLPQ